MMKGSDFAVLAMLGTALVIPGMAAAQSSDLGGTTWSAINACDLAVEFHADGTAVVTYTDTIDGASRDAHWTMDGNTLHLTYDHFYGGIDGTRSDTDRNHIEATETSRNESTQVVQSLSCKLNK